MVAAATAKRPTRTGIEGGAWAAAEGWYAPPVARPSFFSPPLPKYRTTPPTGTHPMPSYSPYQGAKGCTKGPRTKNGRCPSKRQIDSKRRSFAKRVAMRKVRSFRKSRK